MDYEQLDIFSFLPEEKLDFKLGDYIDRSMVGKELTFDEITKMVGETIVINSSHECYKVVKVEKIVTVEGNQRRLVYFDGSRQRSLINEVYFDKTLPHPVKAYALDGK